MGVVMREAPRKRKARKQQNFERNPPMCRSCIHFERAIFRKIDKLQQVRVIPPTCGLGNFEVESFSVCDEWTSKTGDTIE